MEAVSEHGAGLAAAGCAGPPQLPQLTIYLRNSRILAGERENRWTRQGIPTSKFAGKRSRKARRSFADRRATVETVEAIRTSRMDTRHAHLDKLLDPK